MLQKISIFSVMMMTLGSLLIISLCVEARVEHTEDHHESSHSHNTTNNITTTATNATAITDHKLVLVGEGKEGTPSSGVGTSSNSTSVNDSTRGEKQYYSPYPYASPYYNPYPDYYAAAILGASGAGFTGPGGLASSCAYAYPNRRYSCLGQGRRK